MSQPRNNPLIPWPAERATADPIADIDVDRTMVFVPAIMSVGLIFSIATLIRDVFHWTGIRARERRTRIAAATVASTLVGEPEPDPEDIGILSRPTYLLSAIVLLSAAIYVAIGSTANFTRDQGYLEDVGWLLAVSLALAAILGFFGGVSFAVFLSWPHPPAWTAQSLRTAPLSVTPGSRGLGPSWGLNVSVAAAALSTFVLSIIVWSERGAVLDIDEPIARWAVEAEWIDRLAMMDAFGSTLISIGFVLLIGLSAFRCRVMALTYPVAFLVAWVGGEMIRDAVGRQRPLPYGDFQSFPSGHLVQATFMAGLVPVVLSVLLSDRRAAIVSRVVLGLAVLAAALHRVHRQDHWPLDVLAGITFGLSIVLGTHWVMAHRSWHRGCSSCPWSLHPSKTPWQRGVITIESSLAHKIGLFGSGLAVVAAVMLMALTFFVGLPTDPEGFGIGSAISGPVQIGSAALMVAAGLVALRWQAIGAFGIAVAATAIGLFASVQYRPALSSTITGLLLVPAAMVWLAWQRKETIGRIATLAAVTVTLLTATAFGSNEIYNYYFGPTHPSSPSDGLDSEQADWLWLGAVDTRSATIVAGGLDAESDIELRYWTVSEGAGDPVQRGAVNASSNESGTARFEVAGLLPSTRYGYAVVERGDAERNTEPDAEFRTMTEGPHDLVVALGSCARSGSNGAVFDAIVAEEPDLYLAIGDLHYSNLESTDPSDHIAAYGRSIGKPAQAALFSSVPTAYVWDDHDYGPNDSDASSISRVAVSNAYRQAVPHYGVDPNPDAGIAQAFTVGRVRFVLTDTRSQRTDSTMLGADQQAWLIDELTASSQTHALVVWVNPTPWISAAGTVAEDWSGFPEERQAIADSLVAAEVTNLVMVSGDAHMVAIDDGTNSGYSRDGSPGFPVLHAAALDRPSSVKGGPYSHGAFPGPGQFGKLVISDDGGATIGVKLSGHNWRNEELVRLDLDFTVPPEARTP